MSHVGKHQRFGQDGNAYVQFQLKEDCESQHQDNELHMGCLERLME